MVLQKRTPFRVNFFRRQRKGTPLTSLLWKTLGRVQARASPSTSIKRPLTKVNQEGQQLRLPSGLLFFQCLQRFLDEKVRRVVIGVLIPRMSGNQKCGT